MTTTPNGSSINFDPTAFEPTGFTTDLTDGPVEVPTYDFQCEPLETRLGLARAAIWRTNALKDAQIIGLGHCIDGLRNETGDDPKLASELNAMYRMLGVSWANRKRSSRFFTPILMERID